MDTLPGQEPQCAIPSSMTDMRIPPLVGCYLGKACRRSTLTRGLPGGVVIRVKILALEILSTERLLLVHYHYHLSLRSQDNAVLHTVSPWWPHIEQGIGGQGEKPRLGEDEPKAGALELVSIVGSQEIRGSPVQQLQ